MQVPGRLPSLPQALKHAIQQGNWDANLADAYDEVQVLEYPLETRLWKYLIAVQSPSVSTTERQKLAQSVQERVHVEAQSVAENGNMWKSYLETHWTELNNPTIDISVEKGKAWLIALLDRHRPLPAPLLA